MTSAKPLLAASYVDIRDHGEDVVDVRRELTNIVNALPTQIHPTERELYLNAILDDLADNEGAPYTIWPEDVYLLALTAIKSLGRNPVGSDTLLTPPHLSTILHHTSLPFPPSASPFSNQPPPPTSPHALEALRILANTLVLHQAGRNRFANAGGARATARALAGKDSEGIEGEDVMDVERLFLIGRIGFCVTLERKEAVGIMVDKEELVESLVYHLSSLAPIPTNFMAIAELLKISYNVIRSYPCKRLKSGSQNTTDHDEEPWDERFDCLLAPVLCLLHAIPFNDISLPLKQTIHVLQLIPFLTRLLPTWTSIPEKPSTPITSSSVRSLLSKFSNMSPSSPSNLPRKGSGDSNSHLSHSGRAVSPSPSFSHPTPSGSSHRPHRTVTPPPTHSDPTALPRRLLKITEDFFETQLPYPSSLDEIPQGLDIDELLAPVLILLVRAVTGSEEMRAFVKDELLPADLDRSPEAGPLEQRQGILGDILRLMTHQNHSQCGITAGELMWAIHDGDAADLSVNIGYGIAAGLLLSKGLSGPPEASIKELPDTPVDRHPITSLRNREAPPSKDGMTAEEKEREAERLFVLFERLEKNKVISVGGERGFEGVMRDTVGSGAGERWEIEERERERVEREEEERRDEEEAGRMIEELRRRRGRG